MKIEPIKFAVQKKHRGRKVQILSVPNGYGPDGVAKDKLEVGQILTIKTVYFPDTVDLVDLEGKDYLMILAQDLAFVKETPFKK